MKPIDEPLNHLINVLKGYLVNKYGYPIKKENLRDNVLVRREHLAMLVEMIPDLKDIVYDGYALLPLPQTLTARHKHDKKESGYEKESRKE